MDEGYAALTILGLAIAAFLYSLWNHYLREGDDDDDIL